MVPSGMPSLTLRTKVPSDSLRWIGGLKRISDKSLFPMALGSCGHRITHQLRPINMNGRSILAVTSSFRANSFLRPKKYPSLDLISLTATAKSAGVIRVSTQLDDPFRCCSMNPFVDSPTSARASSARNDLSPFTGMLCIEAVSRKEVIAVTHCRCMSSGSPHN